VLSRTRQLLLACAAAGILAVAGCGSDDGDAPAVAASQTHTTPKPEKPERVDLDHPNGTSSIVWVRSGAEVPVHTEPGGGKVAYVATRQTEWDSPTVFSVVKQTGDWAGVSTSAVPNGALGWVRLDPKRLKASWTDTEIEVDLSERAAVLRKDGEVVRSFPVTVGAPGYDTPTGRFAVTDTFRGELNESAYGCCALALSATQPSLPSGWFGGNRIAIHGTFGPLGIAASHGCVRAANDVASLLVDKAGLGTPVVIRA
jgi:lipoprotein-anchoring transpeptidase ErfK/SrfK